MSDDLNNKLKQLAEMLNGNEKMSDGLSNLLSMLANSSGNEKSAQAAPKQEPPDEGPPMQIKAQDLPPQLDTIENESSKNELQDNVEMMRKVKDIMDTMRNINDPRINLLTAIKPFLSNSRQQRLSNCIRLFQVTQITKLMSDPEKTI
ncbi:hypothetical protein [Acetivibrio straminisolvens]|jgi:hypothetical protein|uniref:Uncharacterized protein n=1 Tax=Acetivibrio straminisolvens JCM 21531 TaxID=1294263 RepID=W4VA15_9FIRM|nr:hypothetical protein [Acetivibrio straminisolvens]GAE90011.1 hypothetical protein JCM21531_3589 [Acetivibrio straminisolvens JCM 21531]